MKRCINLIIGSFLILLFIIWTILMKFCDVTPSGPNETLIGLSFLNVPFMEMIGFNQTLYDISDLLMVFVILVAVIFNILILVFWVKNKDIKKIPSSLIALDIGYAFIVITFLLFETYIVDFRPVIIEGELEPSYPSTHMLTCTFVLLSGAYMSNKMIKEHKIIKNLIVISIYLILALSLIFRILSGAHWIGDIIGGLLMSIGAYFLFIYLVNSPSCKEDN